MPIYPRPDQFEALMKADIQGPICMLNLLTFKPKAEYEDGRETQLSGAEAYGLYGQLMKPFVESKGGRLHHSSAAHLLMIGDGDLEWHSVAIMEYPSAKAFVEIATAKEVAEFAVHRSAGLAHQLLVATTERPSL